MSDLAAELTIAARDAGIQVVVARAVSEHDRAERLLAEKRILDVEVAELRVLCGGVPDEPAKELDGFSPAGAIVDALTSCYARTMPEGKVLRAVADGMGGRVLLWLDRAGYEVRAR